MRRKPENNFFSKRSIVALEPLIYQHVDKLCDRLGQFRSSGQPLTVNHAMLCFTGDVVSDYVFGGSWDLLKSPDFAPWMLSANKKTGELSHTMKQWPWLVHILNVVPTALLSWASPDVAKIFRYQDVS
jgi:cytochrome P450